MVHSRPLWDESEIGKPGRLFPTVQDVVDFCVEAHREADAGGQSGVMLGADVETTGEHPLQCQLICIGLGVRRRDGTIRLLNVPVLSCGGSRYWAPGDEQHVFALVKSLLMRPDLAKVFHNGAFDCAVLYAYGIEVGGWCFDSLAAHHVIDSELPHGLGYVGSTLLDIRYWKDDVKGGEGWLNLPDQVMRLYNLRDVKVTLDIIGPLHRRILQLGIWKLYQQEVALSRLMLRATLRGMAIDLVRRDSRAIDKSGLPEGLGPRLELKQNTALENLRQIAGSSTFDPQKPSHLQYLLFQQLGFPVVMQTKTGIPATNKDALVLLALAADTDQQKDALRQLVDFKQAQKFLSTFVRGLGELADGKFHPSWKLLTVSGRMASSPNFQNLSKLIKRIFCATAGRKLVGVDLSQAELRMIAYLSNERVLLDMYKLGVNVHTANVALRLGLRAPTGHKDIDAVTEKYLLRETPLHRGGELYTDLPETSKARWKPVRTLIKNDEFGRIYGAMDETVFKVIRSKRDPDTNELIFPDVQLDEVEANGVVWRQQRKGILAWWKTIQRETRQRGYYQCPISGRIRWYRDGFKMNEMLNCVDAETEALTQRGWVRGFDLQRDDVLLTKNAECGTLEWQAMTDLRLFPDHEGPMIEFRSRSFNAITTPDHRWLVRERKWAGVEEDLCRVSAEVKLDGRDGIHRQGAYVGPAAALSNDVIELCGWFLTDGCYQFLPRKRTAGKAQVRLYQSWRANPELVERIDQLIARLGLTPVCRSGPAKRTEMITWDLPPSVSMWLHTGFPSRQLTAAFINQLDAAQARLLVETMMQGDGCFSDRWIFGTKSQANAALFQMLCALAGCATTLKMVDGSKHNPRSEKLINIPKMGIFWNVTLLRRPYAQVTYDQRRDFFGKVPVWCPIVPNTYFVARREGQVFITGNTPVQTGVASHMNERTLEVQAIFDQETGGDCLIVQQVHDAINADVPDGYVKRAGQIMQDTLSRPRFDIPGHPGAVLPVDEITSGTHLDEV